jgi:hypothetical protein
VFSIKEAAVAVSSVLVMGALGLAGLSVSASLVIVAATPAAAGSPPESARQGALRAAAAAGDHGAGFDVPEHMPSLVHGPWETLFHGRGS